jgi:hypothetical protein
MLLRQPGPMVSPASELKLGAMLDRLARLARAAALAAAVHHALGVGQVRFDVPESVLALVALALDGAGVDQLARRGVAQRHVQTPECNRQDLQDYRGFTGSRQNHFLKNPVNPEKSC